ncbi:MAG: type II toxin-antitoxin system RelE/ParE family toxin [Pseudolabrys sp.]
MTAALAHLEAINDFLSESNPAAARRIAAEIRAATQRLCEFPHIGRASDAARTRQCVVRRSPYLIVYELDEDRDEVVVIGEFHGAKIGRSGSSRGEAPLASTA